MSFIDGDSRDQINLLPACIDDYVAPDSLVRVVDAFVASLDLSELGFNRAVAAATGRPGFQPGDMLRLYIWGYLNPSPIIATPRARMRPGPRRALVDAPAGPGLPHHCRVPAPEAIIAASAAFVQFCREQGRSGPNGGENLRRPQLDDDPTMYR
nr:hypothetical protein [Mesorhizobium sp.]